MQKLFNHIQFIFRKKLLRGRTILYICDRLLRYVWSLYGLGYGKCGVAVIRVSGSQTLKALHGIVSEEFRPKNRIASLRNLYHPVTKELIDRGIVLWFEGPNSFTGEDTCEFQVHGSVAVINTMLGALASVPGLRVSEAGEFTKRAFLNGKLDLTEVDGLADLIHAETEAQRKQAILQNTGSLSKLYRSWREKCIYNIALIEAFIDFGEIENDIVENMKGNLFELKQEILNHLSDKRQGEILRNGIRTAIIGLTNVGKSSCLNLICQRPVSIVTAIAGTTRDIVESFYDICGYPVLFSDTAGFRKNTNDIVEKEGIRRAKECLQDSDLVLIIMDAISVVESINICNATFEDFKQQYLQQLGIDMHMLKDKHVQYIINKIDLISPAELEKIKDVDIVLMSCVHGKFGDLFNKLEIKLKSICSLPTAENPRLTQFHYRQQLIDCNTHIEHFINLSDKCSDIAITSQELRKAADCIGKITGEVRTDEILDIVFKDFCIGK